MNSFWLYSYIKHYICCSVSVCIQRARRRTCSCRQEFLLSDWRRGNITMAASWFSFESVSKGCRSEQCTVAWDMAIRDAFVL